MKKIEELRDNEITLWCEKFHKNKLKYDKPLTKDESYVILFLGLRESNIESNEEYQNEVNTFMLQVISKRLSLYHYTMSFAAKCALAYVYSKSLGINTMIMTYLEWLTKKHNITHVDMSFIIGEVFPKGEIHPKFFEEMWDEQKVASSPDNLLDYRYYLNAMWEELSK